MDFTEVCLDLNIVQTKILNSRLLFLLVRNLKAQIKSKNIYKKIKTQHGEIKNKPSKHKANSLPSSHPQYY